MEQPKRTFIYFYSWISWIQKLIFSVESAQIDIYISYMIYRPFYTTSASTAVLLIIE
jgi:hypothetical protein